MKELRQLHDKKALLSIKKEEMPSTYAKKHYASQVYKKSNGSIKECGCADRGPQRVTHGYG